MARYRLEELGWAQFERLCDEVLRLAAGIEPTAWTGRADGMREVDVADGFTLLGRDVAGPVAVTASWSRTALVLRPAAGDEVVLGPAELAQLLDAHPELRRRVPAVLGVCELDDLIAPEVLARSTGDVAAARALAPVFVATHAYAHALDVLERHRFAVLTGPPEMGKTAIARAIGLALLTEGWEVHECVRPDELWAAFARDRRQVFVADDAFGSTEYRPEAAERWALELDRALRAMDERHMLIWTSRPSPLKAGLRRIHREHGVERFPQPAQIQVAAAELDVEEKALILFRHARAARLPLPGIRLVRRHGWQIVEHPHFTPERIRRFVAERLPQRLTSAELAASVAAEIREPTTAMRTSLHALPAEHRALLVALLDTPPGPVPERELAAAARRHAHVGFPQPPGELLDRLTDHFVRLVPPASVTWVHPSWRDLVIDDVTDDARARAEFVAASSLDGLLLALSTGGGAKGERTLPFLVADADWDAAAERLHELVPELPEHDLFRLLAALAPAAANAEGRALARELLATVARRWDREGAPVSPSLLGAWFDLAAAAGDAPEPPRLGATWIELLPTEVPDPADGPALAAFEDWLRLAATLRAHARPQLHAFGFPERQRAVLTGLLDAAATALAAGTPTSPLLASCVERMASLVVDEAPYATLLAAQLRPVELVDAPVRRRARTAPPERSIVARILDELAA